MPTTIPDLSIILLHADMFDKQGKLVTTSVTTIDVHDIARSARTFGLQNFFVAHPSSLLRKLTRALRNHWQEGFGATYNPNRSDALARLEIVASLDDAIAAIEKRSGKLPRLIATSARGGPDRATFSSLRKILSASDEPHLLMLGTGWGMSESLLSRADIFLEPICGPGEYNHLSVRAAAAICLDRLMGMHSNVTD